MDKLDAYRNAIMEFLTENAHTPIGDIQTELVFDTQRDHYQIVQVGWGRDDRRVYGSSIHLDIIEGKIWLQQNSTEIDVGQALIEKGVEQTDIVLGFVRPNERKYTDYAEA